MRLDPARALAVIALGALGLLGARVALGALGPRYGGELTLAVGAFGSSEPRAGSTAAERLVVGLLHETLLTLDADGSLAPSLAREWTSAAGGREWRLALDPAARFHDDGPVTAQDAAASLRRFLRSESAAAEALAAALDGGPAFRAGRSDELAGVDASDPGQLSLRFAVSTSLLPLASPAAAVVDARGSGAGPFAPTLEVPGSRLAVRAHPGHVRGRPFLERVLVVARGREARARAVADGAADAALVDAGRPQARATLVLLLDPAQPPFEAADVRAAVDASIDRIDLATRLIEGGAPRAALLSDSPPSLPGPRGPAKARVEQPVALDVDDAVPPLLSQRVVACLSSLGLRVLVRSAPGHEVRRSTAPARLSLFLPELGEPGIVLRQAAMLARLSSLGAELDSAGALADGPRRARLQELEAALLGERRLLPLLSLPFGLAQREGVQGLRFDAAGRLVVEGAWLQPR